jgi:hypothetical protein
VNEIGGAGYRVVRQASSRDPTRSGQEPGRDDDRYAHEEPAEERLIERQPVDDRLDVVGRRPGDSTSLK